MRIKYFILDMLTLATSPIKAPAPGTISSHTAADTSNPQVPLTNPSSSGFSQLQISSAHVNPHPSRTGVDEGERVGGGEDEEGSYEQR